MAKTPSLTKPIGAAIAAASAASIPFGGASAQTPAPSSTGTTTFSVEGGVVFSNYWQTTFPGSPSDLLPGVSSGAEKTGSLPIASAPLDSKHNLGGYGSFSIVRDLGPVVDWRFSSAFYGFGTTSSSASASQFFSGTDTSFTNTAAITETDRFSYETFDFDFGRKFAKGPIEFRAFAGFRGLHTDETFSTDTVTSGTDKVGIDTFGTTNTTISAAGTSQYLGIGPRIGLDFNTVGPWSLIGSVSGAFIGGGRNGDYLSTTTVSIGAGAPTSTTTSTYQDRYDWVGNLEGMIGMAWQFSPNGQLVLGDKLDQWYNIRDSFSFAGFNNKRDVLTQTPFLRVTLRY